MNADTADGRAQVPDRGAAEEYAAWLRTLADATRVQLLQLLARSDGPLTVGEITARIGLAQSTVSFHLERLANAQFVIGDRVGRRNSYRLDPELSVRVCRRLQELP